MNITLTANILIGNEPITYEWYDGLNNLIGTGSTQVVTSADTYTVIATDGLNGLTDTDIHVVTDNTQDPIVNIEVLNTNISTPGQVIILSGQTSSGVGPLTFQWSTLDGAFDTATNIPNVGVISGGTYVLTVTDTDNNCTASASTVVTVTQPVQPTAVINGDTVIDCNNPTLILNGSNSFGEGTLSYLWDTADGNIDTSVTASNITISSGGTYTLVVTDNNNGLSSTQASIVVTEDVSTPTADIYSDSTELSNGTPSITLDSSGSTGTALTYEWSVSGVTIGTNPTQVVSSASTYTLTVTSDNGCQDSTNIIITENTSIPVARITYSTTELNCDVTSINLNSNTSTGIPTLTYQWSGDTQGLLGTSNIESVTIPDTYHLIVTDGNTNTGTTSVIITQYTATTVADITMANGNPLTTVLDGINPTLTFTASGSTGSNLIYEWSGSTQGVLGTNQNLTVSTPDTYSVKVTDSQSKCFSYDTVIVTANLTAPVASISGSGTLTCSTTSLTLNGGGSTGNALSYQWKNSSNVVVGTSSTLLVTTPSTYTLKVTDGTNGLTDTESVTITQIINTITASISAPFGVVLDDENTSLQLTGNASGNIGTISHYWYSVDNNGFTPATTQTINVTLPGTYRYRATDNTTGCIGTFDVVITQEQTTVNSVITGNSPLTCSTTSITLNGTFSSGSLPLTYLWSTTGGTITTPNSSSIVVNDDGTYGLLVTDNNSNTDYSQVTVTSNVVTPTAVIIKSPDTTEIPLNGTLTLDASTSTTNSGNKTYLWSTSETTSSIIVSNAGTYSVTITDPDNGCTDTTQVVLTKEAVPVVAQISGPTVLNCNSDGYTESLTNNTEIYAFFDTTSMSYTDAVDASNALNSWFNTYKALNSNYNGNLWIIPVAHERYVDYTNIVVKGSSSYASPSYSTNNLIYTNGVASLPPNFDNLTNNTNPSWTSPDEILILAFVDETNSQYHDTSVVLTNQPKVDYVTDYNTMVTNYNNLTFFKGVLYPIVRQITGEGGALVLQGMAAIEGKIMTQQEIDDTNTTVDVSILKTSNPYITYQPPLIPLKNLGWTGVYDKVSPASAVFTSQTFGTELNDILGINYT